MVRRVEIGILGPLRLTIDGNEVRLPAKLQVLLAVLALEPEPVSTGRLLVALWGEDVAPSANRTLQSHVFQLRRTLASGTDDPAATSPSDAGAVDGPSPASIVTEGRGYRLVVDPVVVDARRFRTPGCRRTSSRAVGSAWCRERIDRRIGVVARPVGR